MTEPGKKRKRQVILSCKGFDGEEMAGGWGLPWWEEERGTLNTGCLEDWALARLETEAPKKQIN